MKHTGPSWLHATLAVNAEVGQLSIGELVVSIGGP